MMHSYDWGRGDSEHKGSKNLQSLVDTTTYVGIHVQATHLSSTKQALYYQHMLLDPPQNLMQ